MWRKGSDIESFVQSSDESPVSGGRFEELNLFVDSKTDDDFDKARDLVKIVL